MIAALATAEARSEMVTALTAAANTEAPRRYRRHAKRYGQRISELVVEFYASDDGEYCYSTRSDSGKEQCCQFVMAGLGLGLIMTWILGGIVSWLVQRFLDRMFSGNGSTVASGFVPAQPEAGFFTSLWIKFRDAVRRLIEGMDGT